MRVCTRDAVRPAPSTLGGGRREMLSGGQSQGAVADPPKVIKRRIELWVMTGRTVSRVPEVHAHAMSARTSLLARLG